MAEKTYCKYVLVEDYFTSPKIKKLRKFEGGDTLLVIYLKLQLYSVSNGGVICYEGIEDSFEEELALRLDEDVDNLRRLLGYLTSQGMISGVNKDEYELSDVAKNTVVQSAAAGRMRKMRLKRRSERIEGDAEAAEAKEERKSGDKTTCYASVTPLLRECYATVTQCEESGEDHIYGGKSQDGLLNYLFEAAETVEKSAHVDEDDEKEREKERENEKERGRKKEAKKEIPKEKEKEKVKERGTPLDAYASPPQGGDISWIKARRRSKDRRFAPPTAKEVAEYAQKEGLKISTQEFVDFYACKDWMVGRSRMTDWRPAARNWSRRAEEQRGHPFSRPTWSNKPQSVFAINDQEYKGEDDSAFFADLYDTNFNI